MGNKIIKSVSFNITVTEDKSMLKHFSRKNFSGYVKKLIAADMKEKGIDLTVEVVTAEKAAIPSPREQLESLKKKRDESKQLPPPKINLPKN